MSARATRHRVRLGRGRGAGASVAIARRARARGVRSRGRTRLVDPLLIRDCVHCGFCLPTCPTYELWHEEMDSPRGRIWLMQATVDGTVELNATVARHFDQCLGCMACVTSCPSGVQYDRLIELARERVEEEVRRPVSQRLLRALAFAVLPHPKVMRVTLPFSRLAPFRAFRELAPPWREPVAPPRVTPAAGPARAPLALRVAFQDSCHLKHAQGITAQPRAVLRSIPGIELVEPAEQELCCGSAGIYNLVQPDAARELGDRKARNVLATEPDVYASANPGCLLQLSAALRRAGRPLPVLHPVELLDASLRGGLNALRLRA